MRTFFLIIIVFLLQFSSVYSQESQEIGGHQFVDLALPSGTLWATCNIGATSPSDCGIFVSWGEITQKDKTKYNWLNYKHASCVLQKTSQRVTMLTPTSYKISHKKYCSDQSKGVLDKKALLDDIDDAALNHWGEAWCMPTKEQIVELLDNCNWELTNYNEKIGFVATGNNGNHVFFPLYGELCPYVNEVNSHYSENNKIGVFWTKTCYSTEHGVSLTLGNDGSRRVYNALKYRGGNVRAVVSKQATEEYKLKKTAYLSSIFKDEGNKTKLGITDLTPFDISPFCENTYSENWEKNMIAMKNVMDKMYKHPKLSEEMKQSAENGNLEAKFLLGYCTFEGLGVQKNYEEGKRLLEDAANFGSKKALVMLFTLGIEQYDKHSTWTKMLEQASMDKYAPAAVMCLLMRNKIDLQRSNNPGQIIKDSLLYYTSDSESSYPEAHYLLGKFAKSETNMQKAVLTGHPYAALDLAYIYYNKREYKIGLRYTKMAENLGIEVPQWLKEDLVVKTRLTSTNVTEIVNGMIESFKAHRYSDVQKAYKNAKDKGVESDEMELCMVLVKRECGDEAEKTKALELLKMCSEKGNVFAQEQLAQTYEKGIGLPDIDMSNALLWYRKAAQSGSKMAQQYLTGRNLKW